MATGNAVYENTFLQVKNRVHSKLAAAITAGATSLTVTLADAGLFPDLYPFHLTIDDEIVSVTNRVSNAMTIVRAQQGTTAAAHANKSYVALNITAKAVSDLNSAVNTIEQAIVDGFINIKVYGAADYPIDMYAGTVNAGGADIRLSNAAKIDNTTAGTLKLMTTAGGYVSISEGNTIVKGDYFDIDSDVGMRFIGSGKNIDGHVVFRDDVDIGRSGAAVTTQIYGGTTDIRGQVILEGAVRIENTQAGIDYNPGSDVDMDIITVGVTGTPKIFWDESESALSFNCRLLFDNAIFLEWKDSTATSREILSLYADNHLYFGNASGGSIILRTLNAASVITSRFTLTGSVNTAVGTWSATTINQNITFANTTGNEAGHTITVTDATTASADMHRAFVVAFNASGAKTGTAHIEGVSVDMTLTGATPEAYAAAVYITQTGNPVLGTIEGFNIYLEDMGSGGIGNLIGLDIGINSTNTATGRHSGIRIRNHSGTAKSAIDVEAAFAVGLDFYNGQTAADFSTADIRFHHGATLLDDGTNLTLVGATLVVPTLSATTITDGTATLTGGELDGATIDSAVAKGTWTASGTWTIPAVTLGGTVTLNGQALDAGSGYAQINTTGDTGLLVKSTTDGALAAQIILQQNTANPANNDIVGRIKSQGKDTGGTYNDWGVISFIIEDVTEDAEVVGIRWATTLAGASNEAMTLTGAGGLSVDADIGTADDPVALFDSYDDALALRQGIQQRNWDLLVDMGVFTPKDTGSGYMMNIQPMTRLLAGGIYQNRALIDQTVDMFTARFESVEDKIERLEGELAELKANLN